MAETKIAINRAPVLTLWAAVVAERLGFEREEAVSLGKAVAGLTAQSKGRRLGIYKAAPKEIQEARAKKRGEEFYVDLLGRQIPAVNTEGGVRAISKGTVVSASAAERYLGSKFGESLEAARAAMKELAKAHSAEELRAAAFAMYEKFRPAIPEGVRGWGAKGTLDLAKIRAMAK